MFTLWRSAFIVCVLFFGISLLSFSQCETGETAYQITLPDADGSFFPEDIAWNITSNATDEVIISEACPNYEGGTFDFCLISGQTYTFNALDDFGDGWGFDGEVVWTIAFADGQVAFAGGDPNNLTSGDATTDCVGFDEEFSLTFTASDPPNCTPPEFSIETERSCDDFNFDATVTIDEVSPGGAPLLLVSAELGGVQLGGGTIPNEVGQTVDLLDLPLDSEVIVSINVLGGTCPILEVVEVSSIGCPVPLVCGEALSANYCYSNNDDVVFLYESPADEPVIIFFENGNIETFFDNISIFDGTDDTGELLFNGNNAGDLSGLAATAESGSLFLQVESDGFGSCASNSFGTSEWNWIVGCGEFDIPGCTDPEALNFIPEANIDDGSCILPAVNDEACGAVVLECNGDPLTGNFDAASISEELTNCGSTFSPPTGDLWFQFEANGTSTYLISAENGPNMVVALYSGDDCGNLVEVEGCSDFPESFSGTYEAGTYYFIVRPQSSSTFNNSYEVSLTCVDGAPENDEPCGAELLTCNSDTLSGTFIASTSTLEDDCSGAGEGDVWYGFTSDGSQFYSVSEISGDVILSLYSASECDGELIEEIPCDDSFGLNSIGAALDAGEYLVRARQRDANDLSFEIALTCVDPAENDLICDAEPISCGEDVEGTTLGASFDDVGTCGTTNSAPGVWYEFTPDIDAIATFSTCNQADFDTKISVFSADGCDNTLVCVDGLDDTFPVCTGNTTELSGVDVFAGQTYFVLVHGFSSAQGNFTLSVTCEEVVLDCPGLGNIGDACDDSDPATINDVVTENCECLGTPPPPGQVCGIAIEVDGLPYEDIDNTSNYGDDYETADLPPLAPDAISNGFSTFYFGGDDVVYEYTPTEDQFIDVNLSNHGTWVGMFVIEGCPFESTIGSHTGSDNLGREIENLPVTAGVTYYIVISTFPTPQSTAYQLNINIAGFDCVEQEADFGDPCDDEDDLTTGDVITEDCECAGTPVIEGQVCELSIPVDALPYLDEGNNTSNYFDDYEGTDLPPLAPDAIDNGYSTLYFGGDDVVYEYTATEDTIIDVELTNHGTWVGLFVITGCPFESTVGSQTGSDSNGRLIEALPVTAGETYYVVISTWPAPQTAAYDLSISLSGDDCPDLGADIGDPCDDENDDTINDQVTADCGCEGTPTPTSQCGDVTSAPDLDFGSNQAIITDEIEVSGAAGTLTDLDVVVVIDHIWTADVDVRLTSPSGTTIDLILGQCGSDDNINVLLDDDGPALTCDTGSDPVLFGTFAPEGSLADFNGEVFNGTWTLEVEDTFSAFDDGTLVSWCMNYELESTVNPECEDATMITATPEFAGSQTSASIDGAVASGDAQCVNAENPQSDVWFAFESVTTNMYIRGWGLNDFDAAVEVYDSCGGELLYCQNDEPAGEREIVIISDLTVGETYYFRVYHAGDVAPVEQDFTVAVAHIPFTQLSADDCGVLDYTPADMITTDLPVNQFFLTNWYFEFTELEAPFNTYEILSPNGANPNFMLEWFDEAEYGRTYEVRTRPRMYQGPQWGDYSEACTIGFSSVPLTTQLIEEQALGFYDMCDILEADNVPGADGYRWKFNDGINPVIVYDSPNRFCQLDLVEGLSLGSPYAVAVRASTQGILAPQGELRLIAMNNFVPDTELDGNITDCGSTVPLNTVVSAVNICAAEFYTFRFINLSDANQPELFYTRDDGLRSINLTWVAGLNEGDTYAVQVLGGSGGLVGEYATSCELTIEGESPIDGEFNNGGGVEQVPVAIELYPNPTVGDEVMINLSNLSQEQQEVMVEIYDLYGKKVHAEILGNNGSQMNAVIQLPELASGIYTVNVVVNEERIGAKKLVVR